MKKGFKLIILLGAAVILTYCSSNLYLPTHQNIVSARERWPEADSIYLYRGYELYRDKCSACHYLHHPDQYSQNDWEKILSKMKEKAKLSKAEYEPLKTYLFALCQQDSVVLK